MSGLITTSSNSAAMPSSGPGCANNDENHSANNNNPLNNHRHLRSAHANNGSHDEECPVHSPGLARLKKLYPFTELSELPLAWSTKDKANYITLSENNLKVHYKANNRQGQKTAASVRATHSVPESCLLYYYEIRIINKGREGYMGIGLAAQSVNMQRLPGWDKQSFGYHGDDGHSFSSSGTGQPYGPTFTTNDVIGCAYNLVENKCFYTKNGFSLGVAFSDLPNVPLFPTVGLQTAEEEVEANFGLEPFVYDIEQDIEALRARITSNISAFPVQYCKWQNTMQHLVQTWLVHNGYCSSAELFAQATRKPLQINATHTRQRLRIQQLVLAGKIGEAIAITERLYPDVLTDNPNLLFALKCRQFIELVAGNDTWSISSSTTSATTGASTAAGDSLTNDHSNGECNGNSAVTSVDHHARMEVDEQSEPITSPTTGPSAVAESVEAPSLSGPPSAGSTSTNSSSSSAGSTALSSSSGSSSQTSPDLTDKHRLEYILAFGRELSAFSVQLTRRMALDPENKRLMDDAFSLLAYNDPANSPVGWQLNPSERESVCIRLNDAIIYKQQDRCCIRPPLEMVLSQAKNLLRINGYSGAWLFDQVSPVNK